jgi:ATP-dependent DNA helicase DinG
MVHRCRVIAGNFFRQLKDDFFQGDQKASTARILQPPAISDELCGDLRALAEHLKARTDLIKDDSEKQNFLSAGNRLHELSGVLHAWLHQSQQHTVYWLECGLSRRGQRWVSLHAAPLDIGPMLREWLFDQVPSVVLTSATLGTGTKGAFDYFKGQIGLTRCQEHRLGSPFDYRENMQLVLFPDMPDPSNLAAYERECARMIQRYVLRTRGHAFVLFTSYQMLSKLASQLAIWFGEQNLALYCQAEGVSRHRLIDRFKEQPEGALFGTDSFWQGVDVPGDALQTVIITRLPFGVPDLPLPAARAEELRKSGRNPFMEMQIPEAVIKLRQGFGRLIRRKTDRGSVVILDPRIVTKYYGHRFLEALPDCRVVHDRLQDDAPAQR